MDKTWMDASRSMALGFSHMCLRKINQLAEQIRIFIAEIARKNLCGGITSQNQENVGLQKDFNALHWLWGKATDISNKFAEIQTYVETSEIATLMNLSQSNKYILLLMICVEVLLFQQIGVKYELYFYMREGPSLAKAGAIAYALITVKFWFSFFRRQKLFRKKQTRSLGRPKRDSGFSNRTRENVGLQKDLNARHCLRAKATDISKKSAEIQYSAGSDRCLNNFMELIDRWPTKRFCTSASETPEKLAMMCGATYFPKKSGTLGEDSHFICKRGGVTIFGIADGVGGCARKNIDPGYYARQLMFFSLMSIYDCTKGFPVDPKAILTEAYNRSTSRGSSTACILTLNDNNLHVANVGDSGFMIFREGVCVYRSPVHKKKFKHPYKLGNGALYSRPDDAEELKIGVASGDIIVAGTDGFLDNMFSGEIEFRLATHKHLLCEPEKMARLLAEKAQENSKDGKMTPFSIAAAEAGRKHKRKIDDITVIVSCIYTRSYLTCTLTRGPGRIITLYSSR